MRCFSNLTLTLMLLIACASSTLVEQRIALRKLSEGERTLTSIYKSLWSAVYDCLCPTSASPTVTVSPTQSPQPTRQAKGFRIDRNGDGEISKKEYKKYLKRLGITTDKGHDMFDEDGDGEITFQEIRSQTSGKQDIVTFEGNPLDIDTDEDEEISRAELEVFWTNLGYDFTEVEKLELIEIYDADGNDIITEAEFVTALTSNHAKQAMKMIFAKVKCYEYSESPSESPPPSPPPTQDKKI